jgi:hypothetical protein
MLRNSFATALQGALREDCIDTEGASQVFLSQCSLECHRIRGRWKVILWNAMAIRCFKTIATYSNDVAPLIQCNQSFISQGFVILMVRVGDYIKGGWNCIRHISHFKVERNDQILEMSYDSVRSRSYCHLPCKQCSCDPGK